MKRRTIREWFEILPEEIRELAIENAMEYNKLHDEARGEAIIDVIKEDSLFEAITSSFVFSGTKQGHDYWSKIRNEYGKLTEPDEISDELHNVKNLFPPISELK